MTDESQRVPLDRIDLDQLGSHLDSQEYPAAYLDPATGDVWPAFEGELLGPDGEPVEDDEHDWIAVEGEGSRGAYDDMEDFAEQVPDRQLRRQRLQDALRGKGAFRRFRDVMWHQPETLGRAWNAYRGLGRERRATRWLQDNDLVEEEAAEAAYRSLTDAMEAILDELGGGRAPSTVVDLAERLALVEEHWSPTPVAVLNDYEVKVVKLSGEFVWHAHHDTDELFWVVDGVLTIRLRDGDVRLGPGQLYVVPRGVEHCPVADGEVSAVLIEPAKVVNTGDGRR